MGYCLLGAHVNSTIGGLPEMIAQWKPPLVVVLDHSDSWHDVKRECQKTLLVGRLILDQSLEPNFNNPDLSPTLSARAHCDRVLPWAERMGTTYSFWQGVNEPTIASVNAMHRYAEFEAERARIMKDRGFAVVVGSFSVGNPKLPYWHQFLPALEAALQYEGALALHEYAWPTLDSEAPWYLLRHRKVYGGEPAHGWEGFPKSLQALPLLITECGLDGLLEKGDPPRGWSALYKASPDKYLQQLTWYDTELQKDSYVAGAAIYCLSTPDFRWKSYDIWPGLAQALAQQATPLYRLEKPLPSQPTQPQEPVEPSEPELPGWRMNVEYRSGVRIIAGSFPRAGIKLTVADPWGNATTLTSGTKPEYGQGGFEALAPHVATYTLTFLDQTFKLETRDSSTIVSFTEVQASVEPPSIPADDAPLLDRLLGRLDQIIYYLRLRLDGGSGATTMTGISEIVQTSSTTGLEEGQMEYLKIYDQQGQEQNRDWLIATYGDVHLERTKVPTGATKVFRLVKVIDTAGLGAQVVNVVDGQGKPLEGIRVVRHWPGGPSLPEWSSPSSRWHAQGVYGPTNINGDIGFGLGQGDFYALPNMGASSIWVADPSGPSDLIGRLGIVSDTPNRHLNLQFQLQDVTLAPAPAPSAASSPTPPSTASSPSSSSSPSPSSSTVSSQKPGLFEEISSADENWQYLFDRLDRIIALLAEYYNR